MHATCGAHGVALPSCAAFCAGRHALISTHDELPVPAVPAGHGPHTGPLPVSVQLDSGSQPPFFVAQPFGICAQPVSPLPRYPAGHALQVKPPGTLVQVVSGSQLVLTAQ